MKKLILAYERLLMLGLAASGLMILGMAVMVSGDVLLRLAGLRGLVWDVEISEYLLYLSTLSGAPWVLRQGAHVAVDVVLRSVPPAWGRGLERLGALTGLSICAVLGWYGALAAWDAFGTGSLIFKQLVVPEWPLLAVFPVTTTLLAVEFLAQLMGRRVPQGLAASPADGV
jgi:TRAP-type C4-dicarboxylate transport system permease small subunit